MTQNIGDFTEDPAVRKQTSAILNSVQFLLIFGLNAPDINDLDQLLKRTGGLTPENRDFLRRGPTHAALFMSGADYRGIIAMDYTRAEKDLWGWRDEM